MPPRRDPTTINPGPVLPAPGKPARPLAGDETPAASTLEKAQERIALLVAGLRSAELDGQTVAARRVIDLRKSGPWTETDIDALTQALRANERARASATRLTRQLRDRGLIGTSQVVVGAREGTVYVYAARPVSR